MALPISLTATPGATTAIAACSARSVPLTSRRLSASASPAQNMAEVSPCTPSRYTVTSMFTMSPATSGRLSGMPWQMTSFTEVQTDFGKVR